MNLVIVESPTKAKTISRFLGKEYTVLSSYGHIRDLPKSKTGVDVEHNFKPQYVIPPKSKKPLAELKAAAAKADTVILATDEDREGEAIAWHLTEALELDPKQTQRIVFHEITKHAIEEALQHPRTIHSHLVDAQQARRILDRLVGYELSPFLWKKVVRGLSAGRVQSVALRFIIEREREIKAFVKDEYWTVDAHYTHDSTPFQAALHAIDGKKIDKLEIKTEQRAREIAAAVAGIPHHVTEVQKKTVRRAPPPPYRTSTLQQDANGRLGFSAKQTMMLAQQLYEGIDIAGEGHTGLITYMRTDSVSLSEKFLQEAHAHITSAFGDRYAVSQPRVYKTTSKGAQEAHEAIRPTDVTRTPEAMKSHLEPRQWKLYNLIWKRAVATQMTEAETESTTVTLSATDHYAFRASGSIIVFDGYMRVSGVPKKEAVLPTIAEGIALTPDTIDPQQHFTEPPARYSDATLVKVLEEHGIGRPSTYAPTIATLIEREYVERNEQKRLQPMDVAFIVNDLLVEHFPNIVDAEFTAKVEAQFDTIAEGKETWQEMIRAFYEPFHATIIEKEKSVQRDDVMSVRELGTDPATGKPISARMGRFGPFVQKGSKEDTEKPQFASLVKGQSLGTITLNDALTLFSLPRTLGQDADGNDMIVNRGRFGPYVKVGATYYSIKQDDPFTITKERAEEVIVEQKQKKAEREIHIFEDGIKVLNGRYGPYITNGEKNARIPKETDPKTLTHEQCKELLAAAPEKKWRNRKK